MTPTEYLADIVLPTVEEFLVATGDRRHGYLACIAAAHVPDHLAKAGHGRADQVRQRISVRGDWFADCVAIVTGICNGSKHAGRDRNPQAFQFEAGSEKHVQAFTWGKAGAGWDEARWGREGLLVRHRGFGFFVDDCVNGMLHGIAAEFPAIFDGLDVSVEIKNATTFAGFQLKVPEGS